MNLPALLLFAAELTGIWSGQIPGRYGDIEDVSLQFRQNGTTLTGKLYGLNDSTPISNGRIEGDKISFDITTEMNGGGRTTRYTGRIVGKEVQLERIRLLNPGEAQPATPLKPQALTLKRVL